MTTKLMRSATFLALAAAVFSGVNNFLTKVAVTTINDPIAFTILKNGLVAIILVSLVIVHHQWPQLKKLSRKQWGQIVAIGLIGGSIPFVLFFVGLTHTSAVNAALIHKTLFLWVLLLAIPLLKEKLSIGQWFGVAALFGANLLIGGFNGFRYNTGELMILGATILWAGESIIVKYAIRDISPLILTTSRMTLGSLLLLAVVIGQGHVGLLASLNQIQWSWTILTSVLLFGYVASWYTALKYAPATYVATLLVPAVLITNLLSSVFITHRLALPQLGSLILFIIGTISIIIFARQFTKIVSPSKIPTPNNV